MSLRWKSALALAALFAVLLLLMLLAGNFAVHSIRQHYGAAFARDHSLLQKQKLVTQLSRELALSQRLAELAVTRDWLRDEQNSAKRRAFFREAEGFRRAFADRSYSIVVDRSLHYYFSDERRIATASEPRYTLKPAAAQDSWYFATRQTVRDYALNVNPDDQVKVTKVWFNVMIRDGNEVLGLAGTGLELSRFLREFVGSAPAGVSNIIVNGQGVIQAHPDVRLIQYAAVSQTGSAKTLYRLVRPAEQNALGDAFAALKAAPAGERLVSVTLQGQPRLMGISYIPELDWYVISAVDLAAATVLDERLLATLAAGALLVMVALGLLVTFGIDRLVLNPLARLHRSVAQLSGGDYRIELRSRRDDELGDLTRAFNRMAGEIRSHTEKLEQRIEERTRDLAQANEQVLLTHRAMQDSIRYASLIQNAILPHGQLAETLGDEHFLLWKPRDVVGGDFYVCRTGPGRCLLGVVDCAGHGVPGAFMTMIAQTAFDVAVSELGLTDPAALLERMDNVVRAMLRNEAGARHIATSMDAGLCAVDFANGTLTFAGARLALYWSDGEEDGEIAGERCGIADRKPGQFRNHVVTLRRDVSYYLTTDGFLDQAGGEKGYGFGRRRFAELLRRHARLPAAQQREAFQQCLADYQGEQVQRDDITVLGFRFGRLAGQ
ncbi:biofilm regulation protein phosphatase SiaA [Pseudogulbenkiania sp. MAI-1]|uniref:biofilm regulation protein phosphatase SiaA n=1 Tax=Pseudogulbenkiania sp. MAI-1 TaxID=990370 RepID=UPI00045EC6B7|nr:biofilm regulation protein phosphatase SiaA [Pseudogulbenkiania sp. MAI-1]